MPSSSRRVILAVTYVVVGALAYVLLLIGFLVATEHPVPPELWDRAEVLLAASLGLIAQTSSHAKDAADAPQDNPPPAPIDPPAGG